MIYVAAYHGKPLRYSSDFSKLCDWSETQYAEQHGVTLRTLDRYWSGRPSSVKLIVRQPNRFTGTTLMDVWVGWEIYDIPSLETDST